MSRVTVSVTDQAGHVAQSTVDYTVSSPQLVAGGIYFGGNADIRPDTINRTPPINIKGIQQYRSLADGSQYPGWQKEWIHTMVQNGAWLNLVSELKHYGAANTNAQSFTIEGRSYTVPAPNMRYRITLDNALAYGYEQMSSGQLDGLLHRLLAQLRNIPTGGRINIQIESEIDTANANGGTVENGVSYTREQSDIRAVAAVSYMASWLRNPPNGIAPLPAGVTLSMGYAGQWSGTQGFINTHPESLMSKLDYMHCNTYNHSSNWTAEARFREIKDWIALLGPIARSKNIIVSEFGSNASYTPNQAGYMAQMPAAMTKLNNELSALNRGKFVMTLWFGSNNDTWGTINPKEGGLVALQQMLDTPPYK
jgi:hypothetical protein